MPERALNGINWDQAGKWHMQVNDYLGAGGITAAQLGANLRTGVHNINIFDSRVILSNNFADETIVSTGGSEKASGGIVALDGAIFSIARVNGATDKLPRIAFKANTTGELALPSWYLPPDLDDGEDITIGLIMQMAAGGMDTPTVDVQVFFNVGDTECGGATAALNTTYGERTVTIAAADVPAAPGMMAISLVPAAHPNEIIYLYGAQIRYTRKS